MVKISYRHVRVSQTRAATLPEVLPHQIVRREEANFQEKIPGWLAENKVPSIGVGIIEKGRVKKVEVLGELQKGLPAPVNAIYNVASLTKPVVAMLTLKLVSAGKWDLDEPLFHYWTDPDLRNDPRHKKLTTRIVLSHQTGFANWRYLQKDNKLAFEFDPGAKCQYSGEGFEYLRHALEQKFQQPIEQLSAFYLFKPLGMKDTSYYWGSSREVHRFALEHDRTGNAYKMEKRTDACAADDLLTTLEDYSKFGAYVLQGAGISKRLYQEMVTPQVAVEGSNHLSMGLGWFVMKDLPKGETALYHSGSDRGVRTFVILLLKSQRGLVLMTNGDNGNRVISRIVKEGLEQGETILKYLE